MSVEMLTVIMLSVIVLLKNAEHYYGDAIMFSADCENAEPYYVKCN
jgi:hypothetical protein